MIGARLSDQRNSDHAGRFKFTNQRLASRGSSPLVCLWSACGYTFNQLSMLSLFTFSDLSFVFLRRNKTDSHDYERSDKREILSRQTCTNDSVILFTASSSRALNSNGPINSAPRSKKCPKSVRKVSKKSWSSGNGSALRAVKIYK